MYVLLHASRKIQGGCNFLAWNDSSASELDKELTNTVNPISTVSLVTGTGEAPRSVGTFSISITIITTSTTLINI